MVERGLPQSQFGPLTTASQPALSVQYYCLAAILFCSFQVGFIEGSGTRTGVFPSSFVHPLQDWWDLCASCPMLQLEKWTGMSHLRISHLFGCWLFSVQCHLFSLFCDNVTRRKSLGLSSCCSFRWTKKLMDDGLQMIEDNGSINMINDLIFFP